MPDLIELVAAGHPTCPYCGHESPYDEPIPMRQDGEDISCDGCDRVFRCTPSFTVSYNSAPVAICPICTVAVTVNDGGRLCIHGVGQQISEACAGSGMPAEVKRA